MVKKGKHQDKVPNKEDLEILELHPLTEEMVKTQLKRLRSKTWKEDWEIIEELFDLKDLSKRPILLKMITDSLDKLRFGNAAKRDGTIAIGPARLYRTYTKQWLTTRISRGVIRSDLKHHFVLTLSMLMWLNGVDSIDLEELKAYIRNFRYGSGIDDEEFLKLPYDAMTCSFLVRTGERKFSFSHKSFMEYFIAEIVTEEIRTKRFELSLKKRIDRAVSLFLRELISLEDSDNLFALMKAKTAKGRINAHHIYRQLLRLGKAKKTKSVIKRIKGLLEKETIPLVGAEIAVTLGYMGDLLSQDRYIKHLMDSNREELERILKVNIIGYYQSTGPVVSSFQKRIENDSYEYDRIWYLLSLGMIGQKKDIEYLQNLNLKICREFERVIIQDSISRIRERGSTNNGS